MSMEQDVSVGGQLPVDRRSSRKFAGTGRPSARVGSSFSALLFAAAVTAATWLTLRAVRQAFEANADGSRALNVVLLLVAALILALFVPAARSLLASNKTKRNLAINSLIDARIASVSAKDQANHTFGFGFVIIVALLFANFILANDLAVGMTFFYFPLMIESFWLILKAFWINVYIFVIAEVLVLIWGLVVAIARLLPGEAARPIRTIATMYTDVFRGMPAIITIYLVGFGIPLTGIPILKDFSPEFYAILALTLTYGAYVAEVYRSGIESIHWSQVAGSRSLGFSHLQTLRYVVVPQAVRRIIPPLLNDFIGLQKDTALVNVIGALDSFNQAKIVASNNFNLSAVTTVAILFVLITIPQARFVDKLIERDQRRTRAG
jgi:polar amino acid transport system permease protein